MPRHIKINMVCKGRNIGDAACTRETQARSVIIPTKGDVIEISLGIDLGWSKKFLWTKSRQHIGGSTHEANRFERIVQPQNSLHWLTLMAQDGGICPG